MIYVRPRTKDTDETEQYRLAPGGLISVSGSSGIKTPVIYLHRIQIKICVDLNTNWEYLTEGLQIAPNHSCQSFRFGLSRVENFFWAHQKHNKHDLIPYWEMCCSEFTLRMTQLIIPNKPSAQYLYADWVTAIFVFANVAVAAILKTNVNVTSSHYSLNVSSVQSVVHEIVWY